MKQAKSSIDVTLFGTVDGVRQLILMGNQYSDSGGAFSRRYECAPDQRFDSLIHDVIPAVVGLVRSHDLMAVVPHLTLNWSPRLYQDGIIITLDEFILLSSIGGSIVIETFTRE